MAHAIAATKTDTVRTLREFWKDYNICDFIRNLACAWGDVTEECMNGICKKTLKRVVHDLKAFAKDGEVEHVDRAVAEMADNFNGVWVR